MRPAAQGFEDQKCPEFRERSIRPKNPQELELPEEDHHDGRVWAALSTLSSAEADSKDHSKRGQLP